MDGEDRTRMARWIQERVREHLEDTHSELKPAVMRRAVKRIGLHILGNWCMAWDPVHLGSFRAAMVVEASVRDYVGPLIDVAVEHLFHGHTIPVQRVLVLIDQASSASLGKCVCRASGVTSDLERDGETYMIAEDDVVEEHLERLLEAYDRVDRARREGSTPIEETAPLFLDALDAAREASGSPRSRLGLVFERTYPYWELLLEHENFTPRWRRNMAQHHKALPIHRDLLTPLVLAHYHVRGAVFTGMEVVNEAYCVCTCPGPENDEGCSLVNWHYFSRLDHALYPNRDDFFGQRRGPAGEPLPCNRFEARKSRPCLGCGCEHEPPQADGPPGRDG